MVTTSVSKWVLAVIEGASRALRRVENTSTRDLLFIGLGIGAALKMIASIASRCE